MPTAVIFVVVPSDSTAVVMTLFVAPLVDSEASREFSSFSLPVSSRVPTLSESEIRTSGFAGSVGVSGVCVSAFPEELSPFSEVVVVVVVSSLTVSIRSIV